MMLPEIILIIIQIIGESDFLFIQYAQGKISGIATLKASVSLYKVEI